MLDEGHLLLLSNRFSHRDYQDRLRAALVRANVPTAQIDEFLEAEWESALAMGRVQSISSTDDDLSEVVINGWANSASPPKGTHIFVFKKSEEQFLAEARRAQSHRLELTFHCYFRWQALKPGKVSVPVVKELDYFIVSDPSAIARAST